MSSPGFPRKLGERSGKISRWGAGGYGFITCPDFPKGVYFKASFVEEGEPADGCDVEFVAFEYEPGRVVAKDVRVLGAARGDAPARRPAGAGVDAKTRALESLGGAALPDRPGAGSETTPPKQTSRGEPATLAESVQRAKEELRGRIADSRARAEQLDQKARGADSQVEIEREAAERRRKELERQLGELAGATERRVAELTRLAGESRDRAEALRAESKALEDTSIAEVVEKDALRYVAAARTRFCAELDRRDRAARGLAEARRQAVRAVGEDAVTGYEKARRRARTADDADDREAFGELERKRREAVKAYAAALDAQEAWAPLEAPFWLVGVEAAEAVLAVAPYDPSAPGSEGAGWRLHSALMQAVARLRHELGEGSAAPSIEPVGVAGCFALRIVGLDADLLPLSMEDALVARPSLGRLGVKVRFEEQRDLRLPAAPVAVPVASLESAPSARVGPPVGGSTREVAHRLGLGLDQLVATLVASGLPFDDDVLTVEIEKSVRALLDVDEEDEPAPSVAAIPTAASAEIALDPPLDVARRIVGKLLRSRCIGGKHTRADNVYGHGFADPEKDLARDVMERLIRLGVLGDKQNVGARAVFIEPRKLAVAQSLAEGRCGDAQVVAVVRGVR